MSHASFDPEEFRDFEHTGWQASVDQYHDSLGRLTTQVVPTLLDAAEVKADEEVLDIATGPGYVANAASLRGAKVTAVDFSSEMVTKARALYSAINFQVGDAERLQFPEGSFDVVLMSFGLLHLGQPELALREAHRVLRSGGRIGLTVWTRPEEAVGLGIVIQAVRENGNLDVPLPKGPDFFRFSDDAEIRRGLGEAAFEGVRTFKCPMTWRLRSGEELYDALVHGTARTGALLRGQSPEDRVSIKMAMAVSADAYSDGTAVNLPMPAVVITGRKP